MAICKRKNSLVKPEGTDDQMKDAYDKAMSYQLRLLDFSDDCEVPEDVIAEHKRYLYYAKHGPRRNFTYAYGDTKIVQAEALYIITVTTPSKELSEKFNISVNNVNRIRGGKAPEWHHEFSLVRRIRTRIKGNLKQLHKSENSLSLYGIFRDNKLLELFTSNRKVKQFKEEAYSHIKNYEERYEIRKLQVNR
jgi:hypothetical protein